MNFFEQQRRAKQNTSFLVFLFGVAVLSLVALTNLVGWVAREALGAEYGLSSSVPFSEPQASDWKFFAILSLGTLLVIMVSALYKAAQLGSDGHKIATYLGGKPARLFRADFKVKQALNVVEEMAIAAGLTPPPLYILTDEKSINAFAAGLTPQTSVVALSQGSLDHLTRDELQGVVAHEISHILNGDTRLNVKLMSYLAGIVTIGLFGRLIVRALGRGRSRSRGKDGGGGIAVVVFVGLSLWAIGSVGMLVGRMIRSAVSRQREFLADASAAQFTRYPAGIAGALAKIGQQGSLLQLSQAEEISHMCFENAMRPSYFQVFATHPPLKERIARLDKRYLDPQFLRQNLARSEPEVVVPPKEPTLSPEKVLSGLGAATPSGLAKVSAILDLLPMDDSKSPSLRAKAVALSLLTASSDSTEVPPSLAEQFGGELIEEWRRSKTQVAELGRAQILPSLQHVIPALRELDTAERKAFLKLAADLVEADERVDLNEAALYVLLDMHLSEKSPPTGNNGRLGIRRDAANLFLSALSAHGHQDQKQVLEAHRAAMDSLGFKDLSFAERVYHLKLFEVQWMIEELMVLKPQDKERLFRAVLRLISHDGRLDPNELEFVKAICECLGIPIPVGF